MQAFKRHLRDAIFDMAFMALALRT